MPLLMNNYYPGHLEHLDTHKLYYPPTKNRQGRAKRGDNDVKTIFHVRTDLVKVPTIIMSDLHSHTEAVLNDLPTYGIDITKYMVLTLGDMASEKPIFGCDGDPTPFYQRIASQTTFYFVQGNHDLPPANINLLYDLKNKDGTPCYLPDGEGCIQTSNGKIGGVHGIISHSDHPYKRSDDHYYALVDNLFQHDKPDIFVTHEIPETPIAFGKSIRHLGKKELGEKVMKVKPKIHAYGHCQHPYVFSYIKEVMFISADNRIIVMKPL